MKLKNCTSVKTCSAKARGFRGPAPRIAASQRSAVRSTEQRHYEEKKEKQERRDELSREYDISKLKNGIRGKYLARYRAGTHLVLLSPDVAAYFPDEQSVNTALRSLIRTTKRPLRRTR